MNLDVNKLESKPQIGETRSDPILSKSSAPLLFLSLSPLSHLDLSFLVLFVLCCALLLQLLWLCIISRDTAEVREIRMYNKYRESERQNRTNMLVRIWYMILWKYGVHVIRTIYT